MVQCTSPGLGRHPSGLDHAALEKCGCLFGPSTGVRRDGGAIGEQAADLKRKKRNSAVFSPGSCFHRGHVFCLFLF